MEILYDQETKKALENFPITGKPFSLHLAKNIALIKIVAAEMNNEIGKLDKNISETIIKAGTEIIEGKHNKQMIVDEIQGGAGTSMNMNVNEVIANRAEQILENEIKVHSIDHVNMSQSTNDVVPSAMKISVLQLLNKLITTYKKYLQETEIKAEEFKDVLKVGRTHLQDATPITLGQEFRAHASAIKKDIERLEKIKLSLYELNLGGTAIGTGTNSSLEFAQGCIEKLKQKTGLPLQVSDDLIYSTQYLDSFMEVSSILTVLATNIIKFMNDLRLLASGPLVGFNEIQFEARQKGSSIMPGKINPVMSEMLTQVGFQVIGNNQTITLGVQAGQLELNVMFPIIAKNLFESLNILIRGVDKFSEHGMKTIKANRDNCQKLFENSLTLITSLCPKIGYDKAAEIANEVIETKKSLKQILLEKNILREEEYNEILNDKNLTNISFN